MSNISKVLRVLVEKDDFISKELFAKAQKYGMSRDEISKYSKKPDALEKKVDSLQSKKWKEAEKNDRANTKTQEKENSITTAQYKKMCKDAASDWKNDNAGDAENGDELGMSLADVAHDLADAILYDPKVQAYVKKKLGSDYSKQAAREYVADDIHG